MNRNMSISVGVGLVVVTCASCGHAGEAPAGAALYECSQCGGVVGAPGVA